jgi:hypothetical protein
MLWLLLESMRKSSKEKQVLSKTESARGPRVSQMDPVEAAVLKGLLSTQASLAGKNGLGNALALLYMEFQAQQYSSLSM